MEPTPAEALKLRAINFSKRWAGAESERAEAQTFWNEFFEVFGLDRKEIAKFEKAVKKLSGADGRIDLFWKGHLMAEHKSKLDTKGKARELLKKAKEQLKDYYFGLSNEEKPRYLITSDFDIVNVFDIQTRDEFDITLDEFPKYLDRFSFITTHHKTNWDEEEQINVKATKLMGDLHDALHKNGYRGYNLEKFLMRVLFCLFADDTGIFPKDLFNMFIAEHTKEDGSDVGSQLNSLFEVLNIEIKERQKAISPILKDFPYVNGALYKEPLPVVYFTKKQRTILLDCCKFDWNEISPAIFGSMFQHVMEEDEKKRASLGAHYTSEENILKVINGLFMNDLKAEFEVVRSNERKLKEFHKKLESIKIFDPACGCGNFLIMAYKALRLLEIDILKELRRLNKRSQQGSFITLQSFIFLDSFYGIEYLEFPCQVAETAMWFMEHKMNQKMIEEFGSNVSTLPLKKSATVMHGNALRIDWNTLIDKNELTYIIGNPPFISKQDRNKAQIKDMGQVCCNISNNGILDYVCAWYVKAADYIQGTNIKVAFVSTNSISQGEQVGALWPYLFRKNIKIHFAHRTFKWTNEAKGVAQVYVVIIGFANYETKRKYIYQYITPKTIKPVKEKAKNINPYLIDFEDLVIQNRTKPLCTVPEISFGSMPNDGGHLLLTDDEKKELLQIEPRAKEFIRRFISAREFLHGEKKWCIWLKGANPKVWHSLPEIRKRVQAVKNHRLDSKRGTTKELADYPFLFGEDRQPNSEYLIIPRVSSENRDYIPIDFRNKSDIVGDTCLFIPKASFYLLGILTSSMHMAWMRQVCGRLKSDYRYSNQLVYNNFPFPSNVSASRKLIIEKRVANVLAARKIFKDISFADMYNPLSMPKELKKAHQELDKAVELCYSKTGFKNELAQLQFLFSLYKGYVNPLI